MANKRRKTSAAVPVPVPVPVPDWSDLPTDLLELIINRLSFVDILSFRDVCSSWRSIAKTHTSPLPNQPPWLMLPTDQDQEPNFDEDFEDSLCDSFSNLAEKKLFKLGNRTKQRPCQSRGWLGSSQGWLLYLDEKQIPYILNPFFDVSVRTVSLPFITKATLWGDPISSPNNYGVVAIYGFVMSKVAFSKSGDSKWTDIGGARDDYCDIVCSKDYVFALSDVGSVEIWDLIDGNCFPRKIMNTNPSFPKERKEFEESLKERYSNQFYLLVNSLGEIFLVIRYIGDYVRYDGEVVCEDECIDALVYPYMTKFFHVYKMNLEEEKWERVESLGDKVLFLGGNQSISVSAIEFPGYEGNSIYFTDDCWLRMNEHYDYGVTILEYLT